MSLNPWRLLGLKLCSGRGRELGADGAGAPSVATDPWAPSPAFAAMTGGNWALMEIPHLTPDGHNCCQVMGTIELCPFADWEGLFAPQEILGCPRGWFAGKRIRAVTRLVVQFLGSEGISAVALQQALSCCLSWNKPCSWLWLGPGRVTPEARGCGLGACATTAVLHEWWMLLEPGLCT